MGQTLNHGVYLPDEGERNCYSGLAANWQLLDNSVGTIAEHTTALAGKAPAVHTHTKSDVTDLLNSNFIPSANNSYDLGSSSYQWNNLYAKNYFYNGTAWGLDKKNVWSAAQFCSQNTIHVRNVEPGVAPSSDISAGMRFENANASYVFTDIVGKVFTGGTTFVNLIASNKFTNGALDPNGTNVSKNLQIGVRGNGEGFIYTDCGWRCDLKPNASESGVYSLGTSTNKWKSLNGVNPGALSLPDTLGTSGTENVNYFNVIGYLNNTGALATIPATATYDGWLYINAKDGTDSYIIIDDSPASFGTSVFGNNGLGASSTGLLCLMCPIRKGHSYNVRIKSAGIVSARIYPAQGNV